MLLRRLLVLLLRVAVQIFFRRVEVVGLEHIPEEGDGGVLFCGNHPNSLLDPVLVIVHSGRIVNFAAKDVLFESRFLRFFMTRMGAVPIRRRMDHGGGAIDNTDAFERLFEVLGQGQAVGIFPEGLSHSDSHLAKLKTGAARIALGSAAAHPETRIQLIPVGLHYVSRNRFRSSVLVQFGPPLVIDAPRLAAHNTDPRDAAGALTDELEDGMRALTVNAEDWETIRLLDGVRRLYQPPRIALRERVELARRFNAVYPKFKDHPEVQVIRERVSSYLDDLAALGLRDRDVRRPLRPARLIRKLTVHMLLVLLWLPIAILGAPVHAPVAVLLRIASKHLPPRKDVIATTKFMAGVTLVLAVYGAITAWAALSYGPQVAAWTLLALLVSGHATLAVLIKLSAADRKIHCLLGTFFVKREVERLRRERAALEALVIALVTRLIPADMTPLFPEQLSASGEPT
jgi:glycerol-3-phosphate O-acyltransferase / dihydroxyacetone phosphate acyltransferase